MHKCVSQLIVTAVGYQCCNYGHNQLYQNLGHHLLVTQSQAVKKKYNPKFGFSTTIKQMSVPLKVILCWSLLIDCFSIAQWRLDTIKISDEVGAFTLSRNHLLGNQLYSLSLETKANKLHVMISGWRNIHVQRQQNFSDGLLTSKQHGRPLSDSLGSRW